MYRTKFYMDFTCGIDRSNISVELLELGYSGDPIRVTPTENPLTIKYPTFDFGKTLIGSGATMNFIYKGSIDDLRSLYEVDFKKFIVSVKREGEIIWYGYADSEMYSEAFDDDENKIGIAFSLTANDGIGVLSSIPFTDTVGGLIRKKMSNIEVISYIAKRVGLNLKNVLVGCSTSIEDYESSVLIDVMSEVYVNTENFIDEDGEAMFMSDVLESVVKPFGMKISFVNENVIVYDSMKLLSGDVAQFNEYIIENVIGGDSSVSEMVDLNTRFEYKESLLFGSDQAIGVLTGTNQIKVKQDFYLTKERAVTKIGGEDMFLKVLSDGLINDTYDRHWYQTIFETHTNWSSEKLAASTQNGIKFKRIYTSDSRPEDAGKSDYCIAAQLYTNIVGSTTKNMAAKCVTNFNRFHITDRVHNKNKLNFSIKMEYYYKQNDFYNQLPSDLTGKKYDALAVAIYIKYGEKYISCEVNQKPQLSDSKEKFWVILGKDIGDYEKEMWSDSWKSLVEPYTVLNELCQKVPFEFRKELSDYTFFCDVPEEGKISIELTNECRPLNINKTSRVFYDLIIYSVGELFIKDFELGFVDAKGNVNKFRTDFPENSFELEGSNSEIYKNKEESVNISLGSYSKELGVVDARGVLYSKFTDLGGEQKVGYLNDMSEKLGASHTGGHNIRRGVNSKKSLEKLLLATYGANVCAHRVTYSGRFKNYFGNITQMKLLYNLPTFDGKLFEMSEGSYDLYSGEFSGRWTEVRNDISLFDEGETSFIKSWKLRGQTSYTAFGSSITNKKVYFVFPMNLDGDGYGQIFQSSLDGEIYDTSSIPPYTHSIINSPPTEKLSISNRISCEVEFNAKATGIITQYSTRILACYINKTTNRFYVGAEFDTVGDNDPPLAVNQTMQWTKYCNTSNVVDLPENSEMLLLVEFDFPVSHYQTDVYGCTIKNAEIRSYVNII